MSFKETILNEALIIFKERGIENISTEALLETLSISRGTLHEIAYSKTQLVQQCISHSIQGKQVAIAHLVTEAGHSLEALLQVLQVCVEEAYSYSTTFVYDLQTYHPGSWARLVCCMRFLSKNYLKPLLKNSIEQGYLQNDLPLELVVRLFLNHLQGLLNPALFPSFAFDYQELFKIIIVYHLRGCATPLGQEQIEEFTFKTLTV